MIQEISRSNQIIKELKKNSNVHSAESLEKLKEEDLKVVLEMNDELEQSRREFRIKERKSYISAASVILTH